MVCKVLGIFAKSILHVWPPRKVWSFVHFHKKTLRGKDYLYPDKEVVRPKNFSTNEDFAFSIEVKAIVILGKILKKEKDLMDKILGVNYKRLNRVFEVANIKYGERSPWHILKV